MLPPRESGRKTRRRKEGGGRNRGTKGDAANFSHPVRGPTPCTDPGLDARDSHLAPVHHENSCTRRSLFFVSPLPPLPAPFLIGILSLPSFPSTSSFSPRSICSLYPRRFFFSNDRESERDQDGVAEERAIASRFSVSPLPSWARSRFIRRAN